MKEQIKSFLWVLRYYQQYAYKYWRTIHLRKKLQIFKSDETIRQILQKRLSISRFGDGELQMMQHYKNNGLVTNFHVDTFQQYSTLLGSRLWEVFDSADDGHLNCLPYQFKDASISRIRARMFWQREWLGQTKILESFISNRQYGDTNFTRFYIDRKDIKSFPDYIRLLKEIWNDREVLLVEGTLSRAGINNDLFEGVKSLKRILCPSRNAFEKYNEILQTVRKYANREMLILLCLGHTATVLAHDLSKLGYQAIDLGHVDVEYEWFKIRAKKKVPIPHRYVNEVLEGRVVSSDYKNDIYESQIVTTISE